VGQFTKEEFELSNKNLKAGKKPHFLLVYFKSGTITIDDVDEDILKISKLKKEIQKNEQIYGIFHSSEDLILKLQHQLEQAILHQQAFIIKDDKVEKEERAIIDIENYKKHLEQKFKYLDFTGLNAILQSPLPLEDIYIKLSAKKSLRFEKLQAIDDFKRLAEERERETSKKEEDFVNLFRRLYRQKKREQQPLRMLILGHPGSGKTTLMKWIVLQCLNDKRHFFSQYIPVFLSLKDLDQNYHRKNIGNLSIELLRREHISIASFFERQFKTNRLLFLLDGLDEIGNENTRRGVIDWIQRQYIGKNSLVVTSRFSGLSEVEGLKFREEIPVFAVQDFKIADVETFLQKWYRNVEIAVAGGQGIQRAIEEGEKKYRDLIELIKDEDYKNLRELAVNPLLLTIIAIVHRTRAVLPKERYKLYEECIKVMIELWNLANRKVDICFSFDNSMAHLSRIAVSLMESNRREMDKTEIETCLPAKIEGQTRAFFLKEMVLKAGLLYESEGKYGFLHLTFQEYLAAWYFANSKKQNEILLHYNNDYWEETLKIFVNIGNTELFLEEVINNLLGKKYWKYIRVWEDCIEDIVVEEVQKKIELKFAKKVIEILSKLKYKDKNEELVVKLYLHYPIYKHAAQLTKEGRYLFYNAPHPFVQSIGTSILNRAEDKTRSELMELLKKRINDFEKQSDKSNKALLYFLFQNNKLINDNYNSLLTTIRIPV
jgi:predicted NACHT family NTPase